MMNYRKTEYMLYHNEDLVTSSVATRQSTGIHWMGGGITG